MDKLNYRLRFPLLAMGILALVAALWAGLIRLGWGWPALRSTLPVNHGPLMISGFLGTLIGLERAVALSSLPQKSTESTGHRRWTYLGPLLTGAGALLLAGGGFGPVGPILITLGSVNLLLVFGLILRLETALFTVTMALGVLLWAAGNSLWLLGWPVYIIVHWWSGFLILTIAGERLELSRVLRLSRNIRLLFVAATVLFLTGLVTLLINLEVGIRLAGVGMVALALWLLRFDVARRTVRTSGLPRFIAVCLLTGYMWLGVAGLLSIFFGAVTAGLRYDALLHAVFVGFVMSMIFGHAPIIFPAVTMKPIPYRSIFYTHLALLHLSLLVRIGGDVLIWLPARQWGGLLNVIAILVFLANTVRAMRQATTDLGVSQPVLTGVD